MKISIDKKRFSAENFINMFVLSVITGLFAGVVVTLYNICAELGEEYSARLYALILENPAFIPLLFLALASGGIVVGTLVRLAPMIRGSGISQIEGAARGIIRFKWYAAMCTKFAASLVCVFMGLSAGAEGPSIQLGGCAGDGVSAILKRNLMARRLQIAAGSSAGLAVAFNAPVTGMVFALEEAFRSFSPQVFVCSAISVIFSLFTRNSIRLAMGLKVDFAFGSFVFNQIDVVSCLWVALASLIVSLVGALFYRSVFLAKKIFKKINFLKGTGKYVIPFTLAGAFGLITVYAMGGGSRFIESLGSGGNETVSVFGLAFIASLVVIVVIRFIAAVLAMGCDVPCGVFVPMLAIGAGTGAILSFLFQKLGMGSIYSDYLVIICMASFFTCVVQAPITGIVMIFELTGRFTNPLPALIGVAVGYLVGIVFRQEPIYEKILKDYIVDLKLYEKVKKEYVTVRVRRGSRADGEKIRSIIWPANGLVVEVIHEDGVRYVADGGTVLYANQQIVFECETDNIDELYEYLYSIVGSPPDPGRKETK